jgi:membrane-associated phospholipid phosphatase
MSLPLAKSRASWRPWALLWLCVLASEIFFLSNNASLDTFAWNTTRWFVGDQDGYSWRAHQLEHLHDAAPHFYDRQPPPLNSRFYARTQRFWEVLRTFGEPEMAILIVVLIAVYHDKRWLAAAAAAIAVSLAGGIGALVSAVDGRFRPTHINGANQWEFLRGFQPHQHDFAHPSGHATAAFACAAVLTYLSPRGRWIFLAVAAGCAVSRVVMQAHFWSDIILGAALGWTIGWWSMRVADRAWFKTKAAETAGTA